MRVVHERCCGLDVHKRTVVALRADHRDRMGSQAPGAHLQTMTTDLLALADWLDGLQVTHVALQHRGLLAPGLQLAGGRPDLAAGQSAAHARGTAPPRLSELPGAARCSDGHRRARGDPDRGNALIPGSGQPTARALLRHMLSAAQGYLYCSPWDALLPGLAVTSVVVGMNFVTDGLQDALDPTRVSRRVPRV